MKKALFLLLLLVSSCASERQRALNKAKRHTAKVLAIYAQYPDLQDSLGINVHDTLYLPGQGDSGQWLRTQDSAAYDQLLEEYLQLQLAQRCPPVEQAASPDKKGIAAAENAVSGSFLKLDQQRRDKITSELRSRLRQGAYRDSTYSFSDKYLAITITLYNGEISWKYQLKPQAVPYTKSTIKLAPAAALPEDCAPKRFWQDWLFWVLLIVGIALRLLGRTIWAYLRTLLPQKE